MTKAPLDVRILQKVELDDATGCWIWTGTQMRGGYGQARLQDGRSTGAHRASYMAFVGPIPDGLQIDHLCRIRLCVNPDHLEAVTPRVNVLRSMSPSAITARTNICRRGHELTPENTLHEADGRRCRQCRLDRIRRKVSCPECGALISRSNLGRHTQTQHRAVVALAALMEMPR